MKLIFTLAFLMWGHFVLHAQLTADKKYSPQKTTTFKKENTINFNGQWKGGFNDTSITYPGDYNTAFVLELTTEGSSVYGYSYTYFNEGIKKYYTICRLTGSLNRQTNEIVVTEIERTKFNTPPGFMNCFQTHRLRYEKADDETEMLRGAWIPAPTQQGNCGRGITVLSRRVINRVPFGIQPNKKAELVKTPQNKVAPKKPVAAAPKKTTPPVIKKAPAQKPKIQKSETVIKDTPIFEKPFTKPEIKNTTTIPNKKFESRREDIVKTIAIEQPTFRLDFYDNGEIDGDSISVFYNGKLILSHKKLTDKPISLTLSLDQDSKENIVTMYAENLGTIPPNTAVMIVTDGEKRYEVRMESDLGKSGSVVFVHGDK